MRVKLDENLPLQIKELFIDSGHDADTVLDEGMSGASDPEVLAACLAEDRVLVTQDADFADIRAYPPRENPGIIVFRLADQTRDTLMEVGSRLIHTLVRSSPEGHLWIVEDSRGRIRDCPMTTITEDEVEQLALGWLKGVG